MDDATKLISFIGHAACNFGITIFLYQHCLAMPIIRTGMFLDNEYRLYKYTEYMNHRLKFIYSYIMYVGYTNILSTPKGLLISDIHCIRNASL